MKTISRLVATACILLLASVMAGAACPQGLKVVRAAEDLYFVRGVVGNVAFLVTGDGVIVVDSGQYPDHGRTILREIRRVTDEPVRYLVYTHYHMDHVGGACAFPRSAVVVAHDNLPGNMRRFDEPRLADLVENVYPKRIREQEESLESFDPGDEEYGEASERLKRLRKGMKETEETSLVYPDTTFADSMTIKLGGRTVELVYPGPAHTDDNIIVRFVDSRAVHMGDMLFYMRHPFIDARAGADTGNWIDALKSALEWDIDTVMPGHGALTGKDGIKWEIGYLDELRAEVAAAVDAGATLEQTREKVNMDGYEGLEWSYMLNSAVEAVYGELSRAR